MQMKQMNMKPNAGRTLLAGAAFLLVGLGTALADGAPSGPMVTDPITGKQVALMAIDIASLSPDQIDMLIDQLPGMTPERLKEMFERAREHGTRMERMEQTGRPGMGGTDDTPRDKARPAMGDSAKKDHRGPGADRQRASGSSRSGGMSGSMGGGMGGGRN